MQEFIQRVDRHLVGGLLLGLLLFAIAALVSGGVINFFSIGAVLVVFGGTIAATIVQYSPEVFQLAKNEIRSLILPEQEVSAEARHNYLEHLSRMVKEKGLVILDHEAQYQKDPFLKLSLELCSDGVSIDHIQRILTHEIATTYQKKMQVVAMIDSMSTLAPAMGLVGTIIGLVNMMDSLSDRAGLGPALSVALLTTLYGAVLSHLVLAPIAGKLRDREEARARVKRLTLEGILSLAQEENPVVFQQRLKGFQALRESSAS